MGRRAWVCHGAIVGENLRKEEKIEGFILPHIYTWSLHRL
jgi:hypothetical protein